MKAFIQDGISVSRCRECKTATQPDYIGRGRCRISPSFHVSGEFSGHRLYRENRDGITPSCPMYAQAVEVGE